MLQAYMKGKDLYVEIASIAMHVSYKKCLEHFPKNCPIKKNEEGKWEYALRKDLNDDGKNYVDTLNNSINSFLYSATSFLWLSIFDTEN